MLRQEHEAVIVDKRDAEKQLVIQSTLADQFANDLKHFNKHYTKMYKYKESIIQSLKDKNYKVEETKEALSLEIEKLKEQLNN